MGTTVLVTGADGFVGRHLLTELGDRARPITVDVTDPEALALAVREARPAAIVHLAARSSISASWRAAAEVWHVNALGTVNLLASVREEKRDARVLVISTGEIYGAAERTPTPESADVAPLSPYAASKAAAEIACEQARRAEGLDIVVARSFPHIGPGQDERFAVGSWTRQIARLELEGGGALYVGNLTVRRDLTDVRDVCRAYRLLLERDVPAGLYNVCSGVAVAMGDVLELLLGMTNSAIDVRADPALLRPIDVPVLCGDPTRLAEATGWRPNISLERTLADALGESRAVLKKGKNCEP